MQIQRQSGIISTINFESFSETEECAKLRRKLFEKATAESGFTPTNHIDVYDESIMVFEQLGHALDFLIHVLRVRDSLERVNNFRINLRSSLCQGDFFVHQDQIYGDAVNLATRLAATSRTNEVLVCGVDCARLANFVSQQEDVACYVRNEAEKCMSIGLVDSDSTNCDTSSPVLRLEYHNQPLLFEPSRNRKIVIGRASDADIIIDHDHISRNHATITLNYDEVFIEDHSSNGTYLYFDSHEVFLTNDSVRLKGNGVISCGLKNTGDKASSANLLSYVLQQSRHAA